MIIIGNANPHAGYYFSDIFSYDPKDINTKIQFQPAFEAFVTGKFGRLGYAGDASCEMGQGPAARNGLKLTQQRKQYYWDLDIKSPIQGLSPHETGWTYNGAQPLPNLDEKIPAADPMVSGQSAAATSAAVVVGHQSQAPVTSALDQSGPMVYTSCFLQMNKPRVTYVSGIFQIHRQARAVIFQTYVPGFQHFVENKYHISTDRRLVGRRAVGQYGCDDGDASQAKAQAEWDRVHFQFRSTPGNTDVIDTGWMGDLSGAENAAPAVAPTGPPTSGQLPADVQKFVIAEHDGEARNFCVSSYSLANFIDCSCFAEQVFTDRMSGDAHLAIAGGGRAVLEPQLIGLVMKPLDLRSCTVPDKVTAHTTKRVMANIFLPAATRSAVAACASGKMVEQVKSNIHALQDVKEEDILFGQAMRVCQTTR